MSIRVSNLWFGALLTLCCVGLAYAQNATGSIKGVVSDAHDAVLANASVAATNKATGAGRKVNAGSDGIFVFENLVPGAYDVKVEVQGFATQVQTVAIEVGGTTTAKFSMTVGQISQTVDVTAEPPMLNTTDTVVGGVINRERIENLPLNGRSFLSVAALEPGVGITYNPSSTAGAPNNYFQVSVGGAPQFMTVISVDGARVNDRVTGGTSQNFSAETVQEFQISTLGFDLSSGTVSAGAVNIVSRTGSNSYHGSGFYFFRDHNMAGFSALRRPTDPAINSPFCKDPASDACKRAQDPFFVRRTYGATIGGPIKKDKLFFFTNYERNNQVGARTVTFSDVLFTGFNHVAQQPQKGHLFGARLDYTMSQKHTAFLRGNIDANQGVAGSGLESTWIASSNYAYQTQMGVTSVLRPTVVNDFRFSYSYFRNFLAPPTQAQCEAIGGDASLCFGLGGPRITFNNTGSGSLAIGNDVNVTQDRHPRTFQYTDNVNWTKGSHRIRFGGNLEHSYGHGTWARNSAGTFQSFTMTTIRTNTAIFNALPASLKVATGQRIPFSDLLQLPLNGSLSIGIGDPSQPAPYNYKNALANNHLRFYAQDAWQMFKGFTVNYGLGWSFEDNVLFHDLDFPQSGYLKPLFGNDSGKVLQHYKNFDPALGFAWAIGKDQKTVVRASASLHHISPNVGFYNLNQRIILGPAGNGLQPLTSATLTIPAGFPQAGSLLNLTTFSTTATSAFTLQNMRTFLPTATSLLQFPFNGTDPSIRGVEFTKSVAGTGFLDAIYNNDSARPPYTIHIDAGVQREIAHRLSVSADFVMRRGVGFGAFEFFFPDLNRWNRINAGPNGLGYTLNTTTGAATRNARNPVIPECTATQIALRTTKPAEFAAAKCSLGQIDYGLASLISTYTALQVKVDKRLSNGFQFTAAYALSRYYAYQGAAYITNNNNYNEAIGIGLGNPKQRFTFSGIWDLPKYKSDQKWMRSILNDWQVSSIVEMRSGNPLSVNVSSALAPFGVGLGGFDAEGDGTYTFRLPGTTIGSFGHNLRAADIRRLVDQYNTTFAAAKDATLPQILPQNRDFIGNPYPYIVLPDKFASDDSFISHDIRLTRVIRIGEKVKLSLIGEGFNIFNIANLTGFSGVLDQCARPCTTKPTTLNFGQPTSRVNAIFGSGGPRAFQVAARLSF